MVWPAFSSLRSAARATKTATFRLAVSALVSEARLIFCACFFLCKGTHPPSRAVHASTGATLHLWISTLLAHGSAAFASLWHWPPEQQQLLHAHLTCLAAPEPWTLLQLGTPPFDSDAVQWDQPARPYPAALCAFLHSIRTGAPWDAALDLFAGLPDGFFSTDGRVFATPALRFPGDDLTHFVPLTEPNDRDALTLFFASSTLVAICSSHSLLQRPQPTPSTGLVRSARGYDFPSRFLPEYIKLKSTPTRDLMSIRMAADQWHKRLGPLDAVTATIVEGRLCMPKPRFPLQPSRKPNHASWERNEAAKIALGPKFATWTWQGITEMVPSNCRLPLFIEPLGAVDKATAPWWRLILDARLSNEFQDPWGVWYFSVSQLAALLDHCDIMFAEDLEDAYHLSIFSGCTGQPFWSCVFTIDETGAIARRWRLVMGCDVYTCLGLCDKAMSGFCIDGFVGRFAAAHFGQRNAGSPLNALMRAIQRFLARRGTAPKPRVHSRRTPATSPPALPSLEVKRGLGRDALHSVVWVDDTVFVHKTPAHPPCAGLGGGCQICTAAASSAQRSQSGWHRLAKALGLGLSDDKRQDPSQRVTFTGMVVDTFLRTLSIPPDKKTRLATFLESFFDLRECTLSQLASFRGRVQHYSACIPYVLPFVALISSIIGTEDKPDYDRTIALPPAVNEAAIFIRGVLEDYAFCGRPLWPFVPSTLHAAFLAGETGSAHIAVITWDASLHGWGMVLRWWDNRDGKVIVGTLPDTEDMRHQVRREALAGVLSLDAAALEIDLSGATVILRNDAVGALSALRKGSFASTFLQQCAMRACRLERRLGCNTLHLHAPGRVLIDEGVDDLSRDRAIEVAGPVSGPLLRKRARQLAKRNGWRLTVDAFASESNCFLPRFFARYAEPSAEAEDAFTVGDWDQSPCPACGLTHREVLFAFPPPALLNRFVAKARSDGIRAIVVTPLAVSAPYWNKLLRASTLPGMDGFIRLRSQQNCPPGSDAEGELAIFAVDFTPQTTRSRNSPTAPPCGGEAIARGRPTAGSPLDQAERARIHAEISAVNLSLRPRPPPSPKSAV